MVTSDAANLRVSNTGGLRHVVMFQWKTVTSDEDRAAAVAALEGLRHAVSHLCALRVGTDKGLAPGNFDVVVVADFPQVQDYAAYADHPAHQRVVREHLLPFIATRAAVQHALD